MSKSSSVIARDKRKYIPSYEFIAASVGDVEWLNQTLKSIQEECGKENVVTFDRNVSFIVVDIQGANVKVVVMDALVCIESSLNYFPISSKQRSPCRVSNPGFTEPENPGYPGFFQTRKPGFWLPVNPGFSGLNFDLHCVIKCPD